MSYFYFSDKRNTSRFSAFWTHNFTLISSRPAVLVCLYFACPIGERLPLADFLFMCPSAMVFFSVCCIKPIFENYCASESGLIDCVRIWKNFVLRFSVYFERILCIFGCVFGRFGACFVYFGIKNSEKVRCGSDCSRVCFTSASYVVLFYDFYWRSKWVT